MQALPSERRLPTLFVPYLEGRSPGEIIPLCEAESRHVRALRLPADAMLRLTDGRGSDWMATFAGDGERRRAVVLVQALVVKSPLPLELAPVPRLPTRCQSSGPAGHPRPPGTALVA